MSDFLWPHEPQHARLPCPSPTPRVYLNSCLLSRWCHPTISSSVVPFSYCLPIFPSIRVFSNESALRIRWPKYWSFSFSICPSNEYSGLIPFWIDLFNLLEVQRTLRSLLQHRRVDAFKLWWWRRLLRVPWTARSSNQSILKEINPNSHWKDWCWSWSSNTLATWCEDLIH